MDPSDRFDQMAGARRKTKLTSEEGWVTELTPELTGGRAKKILQELTEKVGTLQELGQTIQTQENLIVKQIETQATTVMQSIKEYGRLAKKYGAIFKTVLEQAMNAQHDVHDILIQLTGIPSRQDPMIDKQSAIVRPIYNKITDIITDLEKVKGQYDQRLKHLIETSKIPVDKLITQGLEMKRSATQEIKKVAQVGPVPEKIKQFIEDKKDEIKTVNSALTVCRRMKRLKIDSESMKCRRPLRRYASSKLVPCPPKSKWCNYCVSQEKDCFAPKLKRVKGHYRMKPRIKGVKAEMYPDGVCHPMYEDKYEPCPTKSKLRNYCLRDVSQCDESLYGLGKGTYSRKVPRDFSKI
jgi:hypothetical protein